jgi:2',3'-cyclic-nucleotide 2'-phosphodiesterase (5'-nucleotidase family)
LLVTLLLIVGQAWAGQYVTLLHFNDFHGHLLPEKPDQAGHSIGGLARMATMVQQTRRWNDAHHVPTLLLEAGDILQGTPLSTVYKGEPDFTCLNMMGVDFMTLGNHEFDFGMPNLLLRMEQAAFPVRSANVLREGKMLTGTGIMLKRVGEETAAIVGLTTPDTKIESARENVADLEFTDAAQTMRREIGRLPAHVKLIIAVTHLGQPADVQLARDVPEIDVIIGGHSHDKIEPPRQVGQTIICQAGSYGYYLGQLDAYVEDGQIVKHRGFLRPVNETVPERPDVAAVIEQYADKLEQRMSQVVGQAAVRLEGQRELVRSEETNLGNLVADAMRERAQADMAFVNGGGIRASIDAGPITLGELLTVLPFNNELVTMELTGAQVRQVLNQNAAASMNADNGGFLQVSGISFTMRGTSVSDVQVGDSPLQADKTYKVATVDFLATGGNGYTAFLQGQDVRKVGALVSALVLEYLAAHEPVSPQVEGRIRIER